MALMAAYFGVAMTIPSRSPFPYLLVVLRGGTEGSLAELTKIPPYEHPMF
jgi:hypothetical protein